MGCDCDNGEMTMGNDDNNEDDDDGDANDADESDNFVCGEDKDENENNKVQNDEDDLVEILMMEMFLFFSRMEMFMLMIENGDVIDLSKSNFLLTISLL